MKSPVLANEPLGDSVADAFEHLKQGNDGRALHLLERAVQQAPNLAVIRYLLGMAQVRQEQCSEGILNLERAVRLDQGNVDYLLSLGQALMTEQPAAALGHLALAAELGSKSPEVYRSLASILVDMRKPEEALDVCALGSRVCGECPEILLSRALALRALGQSREALECLRRVEARMPNDCPTLINVAAVLRDMGSVNECRLYLERVCALEPANTEAHFNLGYTLLLEGQYRRGFEEYETRLQMRAAARRAPHLSQPVWDGSALSGRTILLHAEQGAGDTIQFARYVEFVKACGGRVLLSAPPPLRRLLSWLADCETVMPGTTPSFDTHCSLLSLPKLAGTSDHNIPLPPRFTVPASMQEKWQRRLGTKTQLRVGLVWAGAPTNQNDRNRSIALKQLAPLLETPGVEWISLQVGPALTQLADSGNQQKIRDLSCELTDYAETAAAIQQLDLVISVDTSVAHLAGTLGVAVWMLTPFAPDWRWLLQRSDSPWYPTLRLYRQSFPDNWSDVIRSLCAALKNRVA